MVINRACNAVKLYIFFSNVGSMVRQLNVNALYHNSGLLSFTPCPFSLLSPPPFLISLHLSLSLSSSLSSEPSQIFSTITHNPPLYPCIRFFSLKNSNDGRAFTVFTSFKTNMWHSAVPAETFDGSALHSGLSELPALEHSCMLHYTIGQGTRKRVYEIQKKMIIKRGEAWRTGAAS